MRAAWRWLEARVAGAMSAARRAVGVGAGVGASVGSGFGASVGITLAARLTSALPAMIALTTLSALTGAAAGTAHAGLPAVYAPLVIEGERSADGQTLAFDLRPAFAAARARGLPRLYVYLGADTCPFCRRYEAFLAREATALRPHFAHEWLMVDLRSSLSIRGDRLLLRLDDGPWRPFVEFNRALGDERTRGLVYPNVWLLDAASRRPLMQMPAGTGTFETVDEQLEILRLEP
ncbi:MAG: hypothetical protein RLY78_3115 [Pseudomonadota bacterium]